VSPTAPLTLKGGTRQEEPQNQGATVSSPSVRQVFDAHAPFVWRTIRHLGVSERDVEDVCQEVFVTVHRKLAGFEGRSSLKTWLYGICVRTASDYRRRAHVRREQPVSELPVVAADPSQFDDVVRGELRGTLVTILSELDDDRRAVFVLHEIEELPMKQIAEIVGCPLQTAYSRLHSARKLLTEALDRRKAEAR
jgi:RNA polymerase sigma-70 factor (ECF subfamily)